MIPNLIHLFIMKTNILAWTLITFMMLCVYYISHMSPMLRRNRQVLYCATATYIDMKHGFTPRFQPTDVLYLEKSRNKYSGCWKLAEIPDIQYSNRQWQVMRLPRATVFLYAAYLDTRKVCQLKTKNVFKIFHL